MCLESRSVVIAKPGQLKESIEGYSDLGSKLQ